jgi:hypothetical protein
MADVLSIRAIGRQVTGRPDGAMGVRAALGRASGAVRLAATGSFSVLAQNMALMPFPAPYKGTDRSGAIGEIVARIIDLRPTVVGLCEVWEQSERDEIREALSPWYPFHVDGPGGVGSSLHGLPVKISDGGLLLLSAEPFEASNSTVYEHCALQDCLAAKGALHARIAAADVFYSHTQDISVSGGRDALYGQLDELGRFIAAHRDLSRPSVIMGDLNIPGEERAHYDQLISRLGGPVDCWTVLGNGPGSGLTEVVDSTFYADPDDRPVPSGWTTSCSYPVPVRSRWWRPPKCSPSPTRGATSPTTSVSPAGSNQWWASPDRSGQARSPSSCRMLTAPGSADNWRTP